jgi:hypothetical protein
MRLEGIIVLCALLLLLYTAAAAEAGSVFLAITPVPDDFYESALGGSDPELADREGGLLVTGILNPPGFSIANTSNVVLYDAANTSIPVLIDKSSIYSEFDEDEINSMRIAFIIDEKVLESGTLRLEWGPDVSGPNREVDGIAIYSGDTGRYRAFSVEEKPSGDDGSSYVATLEVIVDDYADIYYLWYLLPMVLIFGLLLVRKAFLR